MADIRPDNGGGTSPEDPNNSHSDELPPIPAEWGDIVIPDDPAELAAEAEALRLELDLPYPRRSLRSIIAGWVRPRRPAVSSVTERSPMTAIVVIMGVALLTTLVSLFMVTLGRRPDQPPPNTVIPNSGGSTASTEAVTLARVPLTDAAGATVSLGTLLPTVIIFTDGCDCSTLISEVARAAPAGVTVIALGHTPPALQAVPANVRSLAAPADSPLRTKYAASLSPPAGTALVLTVNRSGDDVTVIPGATSAADILGTLAPATPAGRHRE